VHVLEAARHAGSVKAIVNVTTDKCYENREWAWGYREDEPMGGHDPYSNSKGCAELVSAAYRKSFLSKDGIAIATARAGNVIGGGDWAVDRLVPDVLGPYSKTSRCLSATPTRSALGSTFLSPCPVTCCWLSAFTIKGKQMPKAGTLVRATKTPNR